MAFIECVGSGGGVETPTLLWTNPNPSAAFSVDTQVNYDTTLYKYIIIEYSYSAGSTYTYRVGSDRVFGTLETNGGIVSGGFIRPITFNNNGLSLFRSSYQYGTTTTNTGRNIPLKIYGLTKLPYKIS